MFLQEKFAPEIYHKLKEVCHEQTKVEDWRKDEGGGGEPWVGDGQGVGGGLHFSKSEFENALSRIENLL